jgi:hypothetical protein
VCPKRSTISEELVRKLRVMATRLALACLVAGGTATVAAPTAHAAAACPTSGGAGTQVYTLGGFDLGKACFGFGDKKLRANDIHADGASTLGQLDYVSNLAQQWDTPVPTTAGRSVVPCPWGPAAR